VEKDSATLPEYTKIGIRANHMDMTKFGGNMDQGFIDVCSELRRWIRGLDQPTPSSKSFSVWLLEKHY
jgi:protein SERAC1